MVCGHFFHIPLLPVFHRKQSKSNFGSRYRNCKLSISFCQWWWTFWQQPLYLSEVTAAKMTTSSRSKVRMKEAEEDKPLLMDNFPHASFPCFSQETVKSQFRQPLPKLKTTLQRFLLLSCGGRYDSITFLFTVSHETMLFCKHPRSPVNLLHGSAYHSTVWIYALNRQILHGFHKVSLFADSFIE